MEERIALLEKAITDEMARVDTLRDMLIDAIKHQRIEKLEERIEKLEEKAKPRKPKSCETCEEYSPYCYAGQQQFILLL